MPYKDAPPSIHKRLEMRTLLIFFVLLCSVQCWNCPTDFDLVSDRQCGKQLTTKIDTYWDEAVGMATTKCSEIQAQPLIIHNADQNKYYTDLMTSQYAVLGIVCNTSSGSWMWLDGSAVTYKPPGYPSVLSNNCISNKNYAFALYSGGWSYGSSHAFEFTSNIFCTTQLPKMQTPSDHICEIFSDDTADEVCYQVGDVAKSWQDAQLICRKLGANLASIHNSQENSFIRRLAVTNGAVNGVFLGATISGKGGNYGWIDGSSWDYDNFFPGFPHSGFGECIAMDTSTTAGQWMNTDCSTEFPAACVRDEKPEGTQLTNSTCSLDVFKEGELIYSPGFPYSATTPCDFFLNAESGKLVEAEIVFLEANTCCDSLVIYDGYIGGIILATLTGEVRNATYTTTKSNIMRISWIPNKGANVLGLAMTFRGV